MRFFIPFIVLVSLNLVESEEIVGLGVTTVTEIKTVTELPKEVFVTKTLYETVTPPLSTDPPTFMIPDDEIEDEPLPSNYEDYEDFEELDQDEQQGSEFDLGDSKQYKDNSEVEDADFEFNEQIDNVKFGFDPDYFARRVSKPVINNPDVDTIFENLHEDEENKITDFIQDLETSQSKITKEPSFPYEPDFLFDYDPIEEQFPAEHADLEKIDESHNFVDEPDSKEQTRNPISTPASAPVPKSNTGIKPIESIDQPKNTTKGKQILEPQDPETGFVNNTKPVPIPGFLQDTVGTVESELSQMRRRVSGFSGHNHESNSSKNSIGIRQLVIMSFVSLVFVIFF